jgi:hypothetical protein
MKGFNFLKRINSWVVYFILTAIVFGIAISSFLMIDQLRKQEIQKINLIGTALKAYTDDDISADPKIQELYLAVMQDNTNLPIVVTDKNKTPIFQANIPAEIEQDTLKLKNLIRKMENSYDPFVVELPSGQNQYIYYDNSDLLNYFRYYPYVLALFVGAYLAFPSGFSEL